jgi:hypothetical protein
VLNERHQKACELWNRANAQDQTREPKTSMTQEPIERCLHPVCSAWVLFHGSPVEIKDVALAAGTWLTPSVELAREYGQFVYRVELPETHIGIADGPNWEGHFVTLGHIPWRHVELMANDKCRLCGNVSEWHFGIIPGAMYSAHTKDTANVTDQIREE